MAEGELSTRRRIIDAASATLREGGVASISTRRIASRAGQRGLVHYGPADYHPGR